MYAVGGRHRHPRVVLDRLDRRRGSVVGNGEVDGDAAERDDQNHDPEDSAPFPPAHTLT
ncbi:hypothetical protein [Halorussus caseinilyticus]|uniref:Uncharacterized protein n=1 Tax=Halorussus caseinilyticus TaxID=3034025 RepID=A0ABD5WKC5_9EURY